MISKNKLFTIILIACILFSISTVVASDINDTDTSDVLKIADADSELEKTDEIAIEVEDVDENCSTDATEEMTADIITDENSSTPNSNNEVFGDVVSQENTGKSSFEEESEIISSCEKIESQGEVSTSNHYGYWLNSIDMYDMNLTDMKNHGVTDIFLNYWAFTRYNETDVVSWIADANEQDIKVHIWAQIFYEGNWIRPIKNGVINYTHFEKKINELTYYASLEGVGGIHYDYLRFSGSAYYNNTAEQNPGGMEAITLFVNQSTAAIRNVNPNITISAAIMPEPDVLKTWYGDDYEQISRYMDAIIPMVYTGNYRENATWVERITQWFVDNSKGAEVWTGLQGYAVNDVDEEYISKTPISQMSNEINAALNSGSKGAIVFRYGITYDIDFLSLPVDEAEYTSFSNLNYIISCSPRRVNLDNDFAFNATYDKAYTDGIEIHRNNLIIDGHNHTIDGANITRMFNITGKNITFQNINFINGKAYNGGAIYCKGNSLTIINCTFTNCTGEFDGGAVFAKSNNTKITGSRFINNTAVYNGAVYMNGENSTVIKSYFENNTAKISAGAIGWANKANGIIRDSVFVKNSALKQGGGAIYWNLGKNGKIINSTFEENYAILNGGGIYFESENGIITDSEFTQNEATGSGAAIYINGKNITTKNSKFAGNTAKADNGIYSKNNFKIMNCTGGNVKIESNVIAKTASFVINYAGTYSITLKDGRGNAISGEKITFTLNGKKIGVSTTNSKGIATIKLSASVLKTAKAGTKNMVIKANNAKLTKTSKTVNVKISKEKTRLVAKNAVFKTSNKIKNYATVLKDSKGKAIKKATVTLTVSGITYKAITDSKGKAIFKITKLTKNAKFNARIKFAGNSYYQPTSKLVKIIVKK